MSTKIQEPRIVELVRFKQWYMARDAVCYQTLRELGVSCLLIHKDFLSLLQLATKRANVRAREVQWSSIFDAAMTDVGLKWNSRPGRTCSLGSDKLIFLAKTTEANRVAISKLEVALGKFFARWSFRYRPVFSATADKLKLVVDFRFDAELQPLVPSVVAEPKSEFALDLGFTRFKLTFYDKPTEETRRKALLAPLIVAEVFVQAGSEWQVVHTGTFTRFQIGDLSPFFTAMAILHGKQQALS